MLFVLLLSIPLVAWSLHLMQVAFDRREFSFMLAGVLVASTAAALVFVYCSMNSSLGYLLNLERGNYISYEGPINMGEPVAIADEEFSWLASQPGKIDPD